jgi:hypothetical protein
MNDIALNNKVLSQFLDKIQEKEIKYLIFKNDFNFLMAKTSCDTLRNINILVDEYRHSYCTETSSGDKALLLFGILQGLFVGIDCHYTIGRSTLLNKIMININQNDSLREIKHIRNDVVGHPSYRFYNDDSIGFCALDLDHIHDTNFKYIVYSNPNGQVHQEERTVNILEVINNYFTESNAILTQTVSFFNLLSNHEKPELSYLISVLGFKFIDNELDYKLLEEIKLKYTSLLKLQSDSNNRVLWRVKLISFLFDDHDKNEYVNFLTIMEIYKLYSLVYNLEKKMNPKLKYKFVNFNKNQDFKLLKVKISKIKKKNFNINVLHDFKHPLYMQNMEFLISEFINDNEVSKLVKWINSQVEDKNIDMLYLIGSELKK